ncbi:MAG: hypothetical protein ACRERC_14910 [Candidatus Binatia bacterium]
MSEPGRGRARVRFWIGGLLALALSAGCAPGRALQSNAAGTVLFSGPMEKLVPLHPGDWWLYRSTGDEREPRLELSRATPLPEGDILLTYSETQAVLGRVHLRPTAGAILVVSEIDTAGGIGLHYATPVPIFVVPVVAGVRRASSAVEIWRLADKMALGNGRIDFTFEAKPAADGEIAISVQRTLSVPDHRADVRHTIWLRPGVGEVRGGGGGDAPTHRELVCAEIGGTPVGTCPAK